MVYNWSNSDFYCTDVRSSFEMLPYSRNKRDFVDAIYNSNVFGHCLQYKFMYEMLYKGISQIEGPKLKQNDFIHGAIFNVKFSPDGRVLIAACENSCVQVYDPIKYNKKCEVVQAHSGCVNCIQFLDPKTFVTGSDDKTIRIWDLRKLNGPLHILNGHQGWVKNTEFDKKTGLLVSSSFDQTVRTWNIDNPIDGNIQNVIVMKQRELIRATLAKDCSKLFLGLTEGSGILVVHDLNLETISHDLLRPSLLHRNRVELLYKCPEDIWCVYSIDVHPFDWCIVARFVSKDDADEKLCTYDIQDTHVGDCDLHCEQHSRMMHSIKESKFADGFIKEISFSSDGRVISSPYKKGVRLLAFNNRCDELCDCVPDSPTTLSVVHTISSHKRSVLTSTFSPIMPLLVTGCRGGEVLFHFPRF